MVCKFEILPAGSQQRKANIKALHFCLRDRPEGELSERVAAPCISVLVSDLLLHLGICEGFQKRAPLVSIPRVANSDFHSRQRVLAAWQGRRQQSNVHQWSQSTALGYQPRCKTQGQQSIIYSVSALSIHSYPCLGRSGSQKQTRG